MVGASRRVGRDKRRARQRTIDQHGRFLFRTEEAKVDGSQRRIAHCLGEAAIAHALVIHTLEVEIGHRHLRGEVKALRLGQHGAILGDQPMPAVDDVGRGLARPGAGIDVRGQAARRLLAHQVAAIFGLAQQFVAGRRVDEQRRAGQGQPPARWFHRPQVLADFDAQHAISHVAGRKEQVGAEGNLDAADGHRGRQAAIGRGEPTLLVELARRRQVALGDDAGNMPVGQQRRAVVEAPRHHERQTHHTRHAGLAGGLRQARQRSAHGGQQLPLVEEVGTGVGGDAQLRKDGELHVLPGRLVQRRLDLLHVVGDVGHAHGR